MEPIKKAFLDLDETIIEGSAGKKLAEKLTKMGQKEKWKPFWENQSLFKTSSYNEAINKLSSYFAQGVSQMKTNVMEEAIEELSNDLQYKPHFDSMYSWLVDNDYSIYVLTASPQEVFNAITKYNFTEKYGLMLGKNSVYNGSYTPMNTKKKRTIIEEIIERGADISLGITDSIYDIEAYDKIQYKFLLSEENFKSDNYFTVENMLQIIKILEDVEY